MGSPGRLPLPRRAAALNLRGFDATAAALKPKDALPRFLGALGVPPDQIPAAPEDQSAMYRSVLAGRRVLVLLDNACDAGQVRPLIPAARGCLVVVTSRNQLTGLVADGAHSVPVDLLDLGEARQLIGAPARPRPGSRPSRMRSLHRRVLCRVAAGAVPGGGAGGDRAGGALAGAGRPMRDEGQRWHRLAVDGTRDVRAVFPGPTVRSARRPRGCSGC